MELGIIRSKIEGCNMAVVVKYNPDDELIADRVKEILPSAHTPEWSGVANILINPQFPDLGSNFATPADEARYWLARIKYLKRVANAVVEMAQAERDIIDQWEAAQQAQREEEAKDFTISFDKLLKAFALVILDEVNVLRNKAGLNERTVVQLKNAVKAKYESLP